jgi:hypothetical protein
LSTGRGGSSCAGIILDNTSPASVKNSLIGLRMTKYSGRLAKLTQYFANFAKYVQKKTTLLSP